MGMPKVKLNLAALSPQLFSSLQLSPFDPVILRSTQTDSTGRPLLQLIFNVIPVVQSTTTDSGVESTQYIYVWHPSVLDFVILSALSCYGDPRLVDSNHGIPVVCESCQGIEFEKNEGIHLHQCMFLIEKVPPLYSCDMNQCLDKHEEEKSLLIIQVQFIHCTNEVYDDHFRSKHRETMAQIVKECIIDATTLMVGSVLPIKLPLLEESSLYFDDDEPIAFFLVKDCTECSKNIQRKYGSDGYDARDRFYRLSSYQDFQIEILPQSRFVCHGNADEVKVPPKLEWKEHDLSIEMFQDCPGYESLLQDILSISSISKKEGSPSAVLLVGPSGVGKSRMAMTIAHKLSQEIDEREGFIKYISAKELIHAAETYQDDDRLYAMITSRTNDQRQDGTLPSLLVLDDLHVLFGSEDGQEESASVVFEHVATLNAILRSIKAIVDYKNVIYESSTSQRQRVPFILGVFCSDSMQAPSQLVRNGMFEKIIMTGPPNATQRQAILNDMLKNVVYSSARCAEVISAVPSDRTLTEWSATLASHTAGCVALDLKRLCTNAISMVEYERGFSNVEWKDLKEAARNVIPMQLDRLDVIVSSRVDKNSSVSDWKLAHEKSWRGFGGYNEVKSKLHRNVERPWRNYLYVSNGALSGLESQIQPPRGVLFYGRSGNGKSEACKCLASSLGLNIVRMKSETILDQWLGGAENLIRSLFQRARAAAPCCIWIDDIDAIATNREDGGEGSSDVHSRILSTLLNEMDGISNSESNGNILVVATTNRINDLDSALLRQGRLEEHVFLDHPTISDIRAIMDVYLEKVPIDQDVDLGTVAEKLKSMSNSGADVQGFCLRACMHAISQISETDEIAHISVKMKDFEASYLS